MAPRPPAPYSPDAAFIDVRQRLDWDRLRIFHAVVEAGSFTKAGNVLGVGQSSISRQIAALEEALGVQLFHRQARGLVLTEQGEVLDRTVRDVVARLASAEAQLIDSRDLPQGELAVTTTLAFGNFWLAPRLAGFTDRYPDIRVRLLASDRELDLGLREADVALRLRPPTRPDLIQRVLFPVRIHLYAAPTYLTTYGVPQVPVDLDRHRLLAFDTSVPAPIDDINWPLTLGRADGSPRRPAMTCNTIQGLFAAVAAGAGICALPDFAARDETGLVQLLSQYDGPSTQAHLVYPEDLRNSRRVRVFRDFLLEVTQGWDY